MPKNRGSISPERSQATAIGGDGSKIVERRNETASKHTTGATRRDRVRLRSLCDGILEKNLLHVAASGQMCLWRMDDI